MEASAGTAEQHHGQASRLVIAGEHGGAVEEHRVVEQRARTFLDGVALARDVGDLFEEELVHLVFCPVLGGGGYCLVSEQSERPAAFARR